jgi:hypothetical protein
VAVGSIDVSVVYAASIFREIFALGIWAVLSRFRECCPHLQARSLCRVDLGSVAQLPEVHAVSIFRVEVSPENVGNTAHIHAIQGTKSRIKIKLTTLRAQNQ